jgi:hypothetical protein
VVSAIGHVERGAGADRCDCVGERSFVGKSVAELGLDHLAAGSAPGAAGLILLERS